MKVLLVNLQGIYPPIGLGYLASSLEASDIDVSILDCGGYGYTRSELIQKVIIETRRRCADLVGITCFATQTRLASEVAGAIKAVNDTCCVVLGGPYPSMAPRDVARNPSVDFVVVGEGERTLPELVNALENGGEFDKIRGIVWKGDNGIVVNPQREPIENLDKLPFPAYHLFPDYKLKLELDGHGLLTRRRPYMPIFTSRGCPFECVYCHRTFGKSWRARSTENVVDEIEFLNQKYGIEEIHIEDDNFNFDMERAKRICDLIMERNMDVTIKFPNGLRADFVDEELIEKMKAAGVYSVAFGVETASPRIMGFIRKSLDLRALERAVHLAVKHRLQVRCFFMIGFPWETKEEIRQTIDYAKNLDAHFASFSIVTPYPGTELHDFVEKEGYLRDDDVGRYSFGNGVLETPEFTRDDLTKLKESAEREFYSHHRRVNELLPSVEYFPGELLDYYSSPITDYYCLLLVQHFSVYGRGLSII